MLRAFFAGGLILALLSPGVAHAAGKKYALIVGVTEYQHSSLPPLNFTENDAEDLAKSLRQKGANFAKVRVLTVTRGKANPADAPTAANIRKALNELLDDKKRQDTVLIALAGHGVRLEVSDPEEKGSSKTFSYFCPTDANFKDPSYSTGNQPSLLLLDSMFKQVGTCGASHRLVFIDACRNELMAEGSSRSVDLKDFKVPSGVGALFSCAPGEKAWESKKLPDGKGNGVFFYHVIQALNGKARNEDNEIGWDEMTTFVRRGVAKTVPVIIGGGAKQTPHAVTNLIGSPILVGKLSEEDALFEQGMDLLQGLTREIDSKEAVKCFTRAADKGHSLSMAALAWCHDWPQGVERDIDKAGEWARKAMPGLKEQAADGNADAMYLLGRLYRGGLGVEMDLDQTVALFSKAVAENHPHACSEFGLCYWLGRGVERDDEKAVECFRKGATLNNAYCAQMLAQAYETGRGVEKDQGEAATWHRKAAERGHSSSQLQLGYMLSNGIGLPKDHEEAFKWFEKSAVRGHRVGMSNLGLYYATGQGVEKDLDKAAEWYRKSAELGYATAQYELGRMYSSGLGVARDTEEAKKWLRKAADQNNANAKTLLEKLSD